MSAFKQLLEMTEPNYFPLEVVRFDKKVHVDVQMMAIRPYIISFFGREAAHIFKLHDDIVL